VDFVPLPAANPATTPKNRKITAGIDGGEPAPHPRHSDVQGSRRTQLMIRVRGTGRAPHWCSSTPNYPGLSRGAHHIRLKNVIVTFAADLATLRDPAL